MAAVTVPSADCPYAILTAAAGETPLAVSAGEIEAVFRRHGALLLRGFATDLASFRAFARQFCSTSVFNESPDRRLLDEEHNIQSVNGGAEAFPLHPELSREPWKPDACFFCCLTPPVSGGLTTVCDGVEIVRRLPEGLRAALAGRRLEYRQSASPEVLGYWLGTTHPDEETLANPPADCPYRFERRADGIVRVFTRPVLHRPLFTDDAAWGNFLLFARFLLGRRDFPVLEGGQPMPEAWLQIIKRVSDELTVPVAWQRGDLLMLDNSRFMHGRTAIEDAEQRLIASYFGYLRFAPRDPEEPADPPWRRDGFQPPLPAVQPR